MTKRQQEILNYIIIYERENGYPPTKTEIAKDNFTSRSYVTYCLEKLASYGYIEIKHPKNRGIKIL